MKVGKLYQELGLIYLEYNFHPAGKWGRDNLLWFLSYGGIHLFPSRGVLLSSCFFRGISLPPGLVSVPSGVTSVLPGLVSVPSGVTSVPPGLVSVPSGVTSVPPGWFLVPSEGTSFPPGWVSAP